MAKKPRTVQIRFNKNRKGRWFWTAVSPNGNKYFGCTETDGYATRQAVVKNFWAVGRVFTQRNFKFVFPA